MRNGLGSEGVYSGNEDFRDLEGVIPEHVKKLIDTYLQSGNVYGATIGADVYEVLPTEKNDTLLVLGQDALYKSTESVLSTVKLLRQAGVNFSFDERSNATGSALWFLTGNTAETKKEAENAAKIFNEYKTVIVYDPVDLRFILHNYKEWGITVSADVIGFNSYVLSLISEGILKVKKGEREYSLQDNYALARDLDDVRTSREIIEKVGKNKEMLLNGKEANLAGNLIMNEYMPETQKRVAVDRWINAANMDCKTVVTENSAEYELLKATAPQGYRVINIEQMILENM